MSFGLFIPRLLALGCSVELRIVICWSFTHNFNASTFFLHRWAYPLKTFRFTQHVCCKILGGQPRLLVVSWSSKHPPMISNSSAEPECRVVPMTWLRCPSFNNFSRSFTTLFLGVPSSATLTLTSSTSLSTQFNTNTQSMSKLVSTLSVSGLLSRIGCSRHDDLADIFIKSMSSLMYTTFWFNLNICRG
jgi:hypothetical protein